MIELDKSRAKKLIRLARKRFADDLSDAEIKVLRDSASSQDVPEPGGKTPRPDVRPELIRWLATDPKTSDQIDPKGIRVYGVTLPGKLDLEGSRVTVRLDFRRCTAKGEINLEQAETQDILFWDSSLEAERGFRADTINVHGMIQLRRSHFSGEVSLVATKIEGDLDCQGAKLKVTAGDALSADGAKIGGNVFFREGFESSGTIRMPSMQIKGNLDCSGAKLEVKKGNALFADGAKIGGKAEFRKGFESSGRIGLRGARVAGDVAFFGARVARVDCTNLTALGDFYWLGIETSSTTSLDLQGASVKNMQDDEESWPQKGKLFLNGFDYTELTLHNRPTPEEVKENQTPKPLELDAAPGTRKRIQWIQRQPDDQCAKPQPWMQLSKYLEARGQRRAAKGVIYEQKSLQAHHRWPGGWFPVRWLAIAFACLEESLIRILYPIAITLLVGTLIFSGASPNRNHSDAMISPDAKAAPRFQPFIYTLENTLPIGRLGMDEKWMPNPNHDPQPWFPGCHCLDWLRVFNSYSFLAVSRWVLIILGWFQAAVLGAALLRRFKE